MQRKMELAERQVVKPAVLHQCTADTPEGTPSATKADQMMKSKAFKDYAFWLLANSGLENRHLLLSTKTTGYFSLPYRYSGGLNLNRLFERSLRRELNVP